MSVPDRPSREPSESGPYVEHEDWLPRYLLEQSNRNLKAEVERLRAGLSRLLIYARGNPHVLGVIHALLDGDEERTR